VEELHRRGGDAGLAMRSAIATASAFSILEFGPG
jgi:hypothetical protein